MGSGCELIVEIGQWICPKNHRKVHVRSASIAQNDGSMFPDNLEGVAVVQVCVVSICGYQGIQNTVGHYIRVAPPNGCRLVTGSGFKINQPFSLSDGISDIVELYPRPNDEINLGPFRILRLQGIMLREDSIGLLNYVDRFIQRYSCRWVSSIIEVVSLEADWPNAVVGWTCNFKHKGEPVAVKQALEVLDLITLQTGWCGTDHAGANTGYAIGKQIGGVDVESDPLTRVDARCTVDFLLATVLQSDQVMDNSEFYTYRPKTKEHVVSGIMGCSYSFGLPVARVIVVWVSSA
ncbi:hypothetical protein Tco_0846110 [Tanacetum coccineum]